VGIRADHHKTAAQEKDTKKMEEAVIWEVSENGVDYQDFEIPDWHEEDEVAELWAARFSRDFGKYPKIVYVRLPGNKTHKYKVDVSFEPIFTAYLED